MKSWSRQVGLRTAIAALMTVTVPACGGSGGGGSSPTAPSAPSQPAGPTQAQVTVSYTNFGWFLGGVSGYTYSTQFTITIRETAGLGVKGNFLRADFYEGANGSGAFLERQEVGGSILGSLSGGGSESVDLAIGFNNGSAASVVLTLNVTDDNGNMLENQQSFNCC